MKRLLLFILFLCSVWIVHGQNESLKWRYWFDDRTDSYVIVPSSTTFMTIDVNTLEDGLHSICFQAMDNKFSDVEKRFFVKSTQAKETENTFIIINVDGNFYTREVVNLLNGGMATLNLDMKNLSQGLHKIELMIMDSSGAMSTAYYSYFLKGHYVDENAPLRCLYLLDDGKELHETTYSDGMSTINLDVSNLNEGLHSIRWMLVDEKGAYLSDKRSWFIKIPNEINNITKYVYWLNDNRENKHENVLENPINPYDLIALLPVESVPLRSCCFQFEIKDNKPMMYAKNSIHFTFTDKFTRNSFFEREYVDYAVSKEVNDITELKPTQTFARVENNKVKWFKFEAEEGDTIAFKANQTMSIEVFSPSGEKIYNALGNSSLKYGGAHTWESGIHYVAVHDVTGKKTNVTLDYMHMDKHDVVNQDVRIVGNGGCSTITYQGNGFRDLYAVELYTAKGDTIHSAEIGHETDAKTSVTFDFTDATLDKYNALFHFTEGEKVLFNNITVEEAIEVELENRVWYQGVVKDGTDPTYKLKMVNKGNMTAYSVPVQIEVRPDANIRYIKVSCDKFSGHYNTLLLDDSLEVRDIIVDLMPKLGTLDDFFVLTDETGKKYYRAEYSITLPPNSETTLTTSVGTANDVGVYYIVPTDWAAASFKPVNNSRRMARAKGMDAICCHKERIKCVADIANFVGDFTAYGCAITIGNEILQQTLEGMCPDEEQAKRNLSNKAKSIAGSMVNILIECVSGHFDKLIRGCKNSLKGLDDKIADLLNLISKKTKDIENSNANFRHYKLQATKAFNEHNADSYKYWQELADAEYNNGKKLNDEITNLRKQLGDLLEERAAKNKELSDLNERLWNILKNLRKALSAAVASSSCYKAFTQKLNDCPPHLPGGGYTMFARAVDPNEIHGYTSESGSIYMRNDVEDVTYSIECENDPKFANGPANLVIITDTIDGRYYNLESLSTRKITIGDVSMELDGTEQNFIKTMDLRPRINVIAQVEQKYDLETGIAQWIWTSIDPLTMEPTTDISQGILPVNDSTHVGEGHIVYHLKQKTGLEDGTEITNQADIVFDSNDPVFTPVWKNIIDAIPPTSYVKKTEMINDTIVRVHFAGKDKSGLWKNALYVQYGQGSTWFQVTEVDTTCYDFRVYEDIDYGFCVLATDSAGNAEEKILQREYSYLNGKTEIVDVHHETPISVSEAYDLNGRLIQEEGYHGIIIKNRKKILKR